jgi:hypothetical protein
MERSYEEKAATQESARSGARTPGWAGPQRGQKARQQGERAQGRSSQKSQEDHRGTPQCSPATARASQANLSTVMALIRARYGYLAIGLGDGGIRYAAPVLR